MAESSRTRYIILDSCIIQHFSNTELGNAIIETLMEAVSLGYRFAVSDFTFFELLDGSSIKKETERINTIGTLKRFWVKKNVLIAAAHLGCLYKEDGIPTDQISAGDKIIGATALLSNSVIFTTNVRDFPLPFFKTIGTENLKYMKDYKQINIMSSYIEPDIEFIASKHNERLPILSQQHFTAEPNKSSKN